MQSLDTGESPVINARMPGTLVEEMDRVRALKGMDRSAFLRLALADLIRRIDESGEGEAA